MKRLIKSFALVCVSAMLFTACGQQAPAPAQKETKTETAGEATTASVQAMDGKTLDGIMEDKKLKEDYLVIDVRSAEDYNAGHVNYAINMFVDDLEKNLDKIDAYKEKNVVTICNSGKKSQVAAELLVKNGFKNVFNAEGVKSFQYTTIVKNENLLGAQLQEIADTNDGSVVIVDVRDTKDYEAGHLKGAMSIPFDKVDAEIANVPKDKTIVTYCYSGNKSAATAQKFVDAGYATVKNTLDGTKEYEYKLEK